MRIFNLSTSRIPSDSANSVQVVRTTEAIAHLNFKISLFCATGSREYDAHAYYGIGKELEIIKLPLMKIPFLGLFLRAILVLKKIGEFNIKPEDVFYGRDRYSLLLLSLVYKNKIILESHKSPEKFLHRSMDFFLLKKGSRIVVTSQALLKAYQAASADEKLSKNIHVIRNGSSDFLMEKSDKGEGYTVGYVGGVSQRKGIDFIVELAKKMPHVVFVLVGPIRDSQTKIKNINNIIAVGHKSQNDIKNYYRKFDAVIAPYPDDNKLNLVTEFPSPLKISEYFSTGLPIIASRNSATEELIESGVDGILVRNEVSEWIKVIEELRSNVAFAKTLGVSARNKYEAGFSWEARARMLSELFKCH